MFRRVEFIVPLGCTLRRMGFGPKDDCMNTFKSDVWLLSALS